MQKIGIITDTNSGMTAAEAEQLGVALMPMPFTVNGRNYVENVNMSYREFFEWAAPKLATLVRLAGEGRIR